MKNAIIAGLGLGGGFIGLVAVGATVVEYNRNRAAVVIAEAQAAQMHAIVAQQNVATAALRWQVWQGQMLPVLLLVACVALIVALCVACVALYRERRNFEATLATLLQHV